MAHVAREQVRAWRSARGGLASPFVDLAAALETFHRLTDGGWTYTALLARLTRFSCAAFDEAVVRSRSWRPYSVRWDQSAVLVPAHLLPSLHACAAFRSASRIARRKPWREVAEAVGTLRGQVLDALTSGPQTFDAVENALGPRLKAAGLRHQLFMAVHGLASRGEVDLALPHDSLRLTPSWGSYVLTAGPNAGGDPAFSPGDWGFLSELAEHYFKRAGPATRDDFAWWLQISKAAARVTLEDLSGSLEEVDIEGERQAHFVMEEDGVQLRAFRPPPTRHVALLPILDPIATATRQAFLRDLAPDEPIRREGAPRSEEGRPARIVRPIVVGGRLAGSWKWDHGNARVSTRLNAPVGEEAGERLYEATERLRRMVVGELALLPNGAPSLSPREWWF